MDGGAGVAGLDLGRDGSGLVDGNGQADAAAQQPSQLPPDFPGYGDPDTNAVFTEAQEAMERGDMDSAAAAFEKVLAGSPGDPVATMGLGQVNLIRRVEGYDEAAARREADEQPGNPLAQAKVADIDLATGRIETSFDRLLDTIRRTSGDDREKARQHLVSLFDIFPPKDPRVTKARAKLSSLLF